MALTPNYRCSFIFKANMFPMAFEPKQPVDGILFCEGLSQVHHVAFVVHLVKVNSAGSVVDFRRKDKRLSQMEIFAASEKTLAPCPSDDDS